MAGCAGEISEYLVRMYHFLILHEYFSVSVHYISFIDPPLGGFGEIFLEVMIFPSGYRPLEISSLQEIFRRIPLAPGL